MLCYFNLTNGIEIIRDDDGVEVTCLSGAVIHAQMAIEELRAEAPSSSDGWQGWWLEIVDEVGMPVRRLPLDKSLPELSFRH